MAYLYIDENSPEEQEYSTNYLYFNEKEPGVLQKMMKKYRQYAGKARCRGKGYELLDDDRLNRAMVYVMSR